MKCGGLKVKDADLWILIWVELQVHQEGTLEVEHVKAHRSEKEKQQLSLSENCHGGQREGRRASKRWSNDGWRSDGADSCQHSPAKNSQLSWSGGGVERL